MSIAQQVTMVRDALGLKMSELAQMFGVTRPSAYAWLKGSEPKPEIKIRIYKARRLVDDLHGAGIKRIDLYARLPLASGQSLLDSLLSGTDLEGQVSAIKRTVLQPVPAVPADIERGRANRKRVVGLDEISTSIFA
jgi:DNA-binding XRE family transcriptional regulator